MYEMFRTLTIPLWWSFQLRQEKVELEETLEKEQEYQVNKLMRKIEKLERDTVNKQATLEQVIIASRLLFMPWRVNVYLQTVAVLPLIFQVLFNLYPAIHLYMYVPLHAGWTSPQFAWIQNYKLQHKS